MQWTLALACAGVVFGLLAWHLHHARPSPEAGLVHDPEFSVQLLDGMAPDIEVKTKDGGTLKLSDLRGKVVFVNFWATWCPPCRAEVPDLEKLAAEMKHSPFEVLAVSSDQGFEDIDAFFEGRPTALRIGLDAEQRWAAVYGTEKLPETYVVDRKGRLRLRFVNVHPWTDSRIQRYLEWLATDG
ncbi:MAG: TlpA family protein disulfide reductase [Myxococcales bacterium]|nr:TlpA family protein disulfide reductase [Myxococcales bacterium]MCB9549487.1 TlpA family protein disulfide reductase [Myxococcales bacterium]